VTKLNNDEINVYDDILKKYKREYKRVLLIKQNFMNNYIDATKLKNRHLSINCAKKKDTKSGETSWCDVKNLFNIIKENYTIIIDEYYQIYNLKNLPIQA
jgi:hypothetical protein